MARQPRCTCMREQVEKLIANFPKEVEDVSDKEAQNRMLVVLVFHALVPLLTQEHQSMEKEDDQKTISVYDHASQELEFRCQNLRSNHVGSVPGVKVGDVFQSRRLLTLIGLHGPIEGGIYYLKPVQTGDTVPFATSIVYSGGYEDNIDNGDVILYSGQGGKDFTTKKQISDQPLTLGNTALMYSNVYEKPVRVIRSCQELPCGYRYDGLYNVENYWLEKGCQGFLVYMFKLRRKQNQPPLVSQIVLFKGRLRGKKTSPRAIKEDISERREKVCISVVNSLDNVHTFDDFIYFTTVQFQDNRPKEEVPKGCNCVGECTDARKCLCAIKNKGRFPYKNNGILIKPKVVVYECGPSCRCPPTCTNRVAQRGLKHELEIFRTYDQNWGVKTLDFIEEGAFIAEYTGDLTVQPTTNNLVNKYIFPIYSISRNGNSGDSDSASLFQLFEDKGYTVDASRRGNASRFIRSNLRPRNSTPNTFVQYVLHDHNNTDIPHVMLFARENISPGMELFISSSAEQAFHDQLFQKPRHMNKERKTSKFRK